MPSKDQPQTQTQSKMNCKMNKNKNKNTTLERVAIASVNSDAALTSSSSNADKDESQKKDAIETYKQILEKEESQLFSRVDKMLEKERFDNKSEKWNRLDNSIRIEKLYEFADVQFENLFLEKYSRGAAKAAEAAEAGAEAAKAAAGDGDSKREPGGDFLADGIRRLKEFFEESLKKKKLLKVKEIAYNRELGKIDYIHSLQYHEEHDFFYLKNNNTVGGNHISTMKSLTPKRA